MGGILDGFPSNVAIDYDHLFTWLSRRRPGQSKVTTQRDEKDAVEFLSGLLDGVTTGAPIGFQIQNKDQRSGDYDSLKDLYRPSHADMVYEKKYGIRDHRGSGRASARETVNWVVAGALANQVIAVRGIAVNAFVSGVGSLQLDSGESMDYAKRWNNPMRCPDVDLANQMEELVEGIRKEGDSVGGRIRCEISNLPVGLGEPVFDKLEAALAHAMMSLPASKAFEIGSGVGASSMKGSEHNDEWTNDDGKLKTTSNHSGGVQGGISNGMPVNFTVHFKPTSTISKEQSTVTSGGESTVLSAKGRHDPCVVPRAVPIVEALASFVILDHMMLARLI